MEIAMEEKENNPFYGHKEACWQDYRWHKEHRPESLPQLSAFLKETYGYDTTEW